jgi:WD40 repeat protein
LAIVAIALGVGYHMKVKAEERAEEDRIIVDEQLDQEGNRLVEEKLRLATLEELAEIDRERRNAVAKAEEERQKGLERLLSVADQETTRLRLERQEAARKERAAIQTPAAKPKEVADYLKAVRASGLLAEREQTRELRLALEPFRAKAGQPDIRNWEWHFLDALARGQESSPVRLLFRRRIHDVPQGSAHRPEVAWGNNGSLLSVRDSLCDVQIRDSVTGAEIRRLQNKLRQHVDTPYYEIRPFQMSPDGLWLTQTFGTRTGQNAKLWDLSNGTVGKEFADVSSAVSWSPDGRLLYLGSDRIWNIGKSSEQKLAEHPGNVCCSAWKADGSCLATGSNERGIRFWDPETGREIGESLSLGADAKAVAWSPGGKWIAVFAGPTVSVWDTHTRKQMWSLLHTPFMNYWGRLSWSLDGRRLVIFAGGESPKKLLDGATGREIFSADSDAAFCPDGRRLAMLSTQKSPGILIIDADTGQEVLRFGGVEPGRLTWSPDGKCLALAADKGILHVWRIGPPENPNDCLTLQVGGKPALSPDGTRCAFPARGFGAGQVKIVTMAHPELGVVVAPQDEAHPAERMAVAQITKLNWSPDGKYLATAHDGTINLWEIAGGKRVWALNGHRKVTGGFFRIHALAWGPRGRWLASSAENGTIKVWDTVTGKEALSFDLGGGDPELSWSGDGNFLAASSMSVTRVWEIPSGKVVHSLNQHFRPTVMSPDRKFLAAVDTGAVKLWDVRSGSKLSPLVSGEQYYTGHILGWSPDARYLIYTVQDTHIWDMQERTRKDAPGIARHAVWDPEGKTVLLGFGSNDYWQFKAFDPKTGNQVRDFGKVLIGNSQMAPPQLLWTRDGPKLAMAHEVRYRSKGPLLLVQVAPHGIGEKSAEQGVVEVVDLGSGDRRFTARVLQTGPTSSMNVALLASAWKSDGTAFATVHEDSVLRLWHPVTGKQLLRRTTPQQLLSFSDPNSPNAPLAWAPNGQLVACARNNFIQVWNLMDEKQSRAIRPDSRPTHGFSVQSLAWSPDNRRLAALVHGGQEVVVKIWDTASWKEIRSYSLEGRAGSTATRLLCWSPNSKRLAAGCKAVHVRDVETGTELFVLSDHTVPLESLEWSDDGHRIISRAAAELIVWDADLGDQVLKLTGSSAEYRASPDWNWLAVPSADNGVSRLQRIGALDK